MPERWKEVNRRDLQGETLRADEDRWEIGGITRWARWEVLAWRNPDGTVGGILVFAEDITKRKQMEDRIRELERQISRAETVIAECETALQSFVNVEETQKHSEELNRQKGAHAAFIHEWEELSQSLQEVD